MVTIRRLELVPFAVPLRTPLATAPGAITHRAGVVVVLHARDGRVGVGEAAPHPAAPAGAHDALRDALRAATSWLTGASLDRLDELLAACPLGQPAAAAGLDMALHDLAGVVTGRPVAELLGGLRRAAIGASALLSGATPDALATAARAAATQGYAAAKVKVGPDVAAAAARLDAVRAAAPGLSLRADANGCWPGTRAPAAAAQLAPRGLAWLEQPAPPGDDATLAACRRAGLRIAADESVDGPDAVARLAAAAAADVVVLKLVQVGGLARAVATAAAARRCGLDVVVTTALETSIATAAALQLAGALPGPLPPCGVATTDLLAGDLVRAPLRPAPAMALPAGPGLGVALDPAALARFGVAEAA